MAPQLPNQLERLLNDALVETPSGRSIWVALSGGLDSALLLTLAASVCRQANRPLRAIHIHHGLQAAADDFEQHCQVLCKQLGVPLSVVRVTVDAAGGIEAAARQARYAAFHEHVPTGDTVWLAQHQDDQAETFLLAALRGSGIRGLAGMPHCRHAHGLTFVRPWLSIARRCLEGRACQIGLEWREDPTNSDVTLDRNRLRHDVLPLLKARWPDMAGAFSHSAKHAGEADALLSEYAQAELEALRTDANSADLECIDALALATRSRPRQRLLIRSWCQQRLLPTPPQRRLETLLDQLTAAPDASVHVTWPGAEARVWQQRLYLMAPLEPLPAWQCAWDGRAGQATPLGALELSLKSDTPLTLRWRQGGEVIALAERGRRDVKRLLQEAQIPPWERERLVMVMAEDTCLGVVQPPARVLWKAANVRFVS